MNGTTQRAVCEIVSAIQFCKKEGQQGKKKRPGATGSEKVVVGVHREEAGSDAFVWDRRWTGNCRVSQP